MESGVDERQVDGATGGEATPRGPAPIARSAHVAVSDVLPVVTDRQPMLWFENVCVTGEHHQTGCFDTWSVAEEYREYRSLLRVTIRFMHPRTPSRHESEPALARSLLAEYESRVNGRFDQVVGLIPAFPTRDRASTRASLGASTLLWRSLLTPLRVGAGPCTPMSTLLCPMRVCAQHAFSTVTYGAAARFLGLRWAAPFSDAPNDTPTVQISDVVRHIFKSNGCWHITCMVGTLLTEGPHRDDALCTLVDFIIIDPDKEFICEEHMGLGEWHHRWKAAAFNANDGTATHPQERFCDLT